MIYFNTTSKYYEIEPGLVVHAYNILTTRTWSACLLQKTSGGHSSLFTIREDSEGAENVTLKGGYGEFTTQRLPAEIESLKGEARYTAYDAWKRGIYAHAHGLIKRAFPEFATARGSMGRLEIELAPDRCSCREEGIIPQPCPLHG